MGILVGIGVLLITAYLLAAALQKTAVLKPYLGLFAVAGLLAVAALGFAGGNAAQWLMLAAKVLAIFSCLAMCVHLAVLVAKRVSEQRG